MTDAAEGSDGPTIDTAPGPSATYTLNADFDQGQYFNVGHPVPNQLELQATYPFKFIWIAVSTKGTAVRIDTTTGQIKGEYFTSPAGMAKDPSRTTVDKNGNVWVTNRAEASVLNGVAQGSIIHIGLNDNGQCQDRNGNGVIDTSTGLGDVRAWSNAGAVDTDGGVQTATDECIIHFVRTKSTLNRHVSVTPTNDVWVSGTGVRSFSLISGSTGAILRQEGTVNCGGYGGLIDGAGVIWSSTQGSLLRWNTALPLTTTNSICISTANAYGLCKDSLGNVWSASLTGGQLRKWSPAGALLGTFAHGNQYAQGCAIDKKDHVWVAHSILGPQNTVGHVLPSGVFVGNVVVGSGPTGVSVDGDGKVWATNYYSRTASRIHPGLGPVGGGGATVGAVDLTTADLGGNLYNYSDMTGSLLSGAPNFGTWAIVHDSAIAGARWGRVSWSSLVPSGGSLTVRVTSSDNPGSFPPSIAVSNGACFNAPNGRYLRVLVSFVRAPSGQSPILYDLSVSARPYDAADGVALQVSNNVPVTAGYRTPGAAIVDSGSASGYIARADIATGTAYASVLDEAASGTNSCTRAQATAMTRVAYASLAGGAVQVEGLRHEATASYDAITGAGSFSRDWFIAKLTVNGQVVRVDQNSALPQTIAVPNVGKLVLFGGNPTTAPGGLGYEYRGELLHLYLDPLVPVKYGDADLIVGAVHVQAGMYPPTAPPAIQDDARSGNDAPSSQTGAPGVALGPSDGALPEGDTVDTYAYTTVGPLTKLVIALEPGHSVQAMGGRVTATAPPPSVTHTLPAVAATPAPGSTLDGYRVRVLAPGGAVIATSGTGTASGPVTLQATASGLVFIEVSRLDTVATAQNVNYSLVIAQAP